MKKIIVEHKTNGDIHETVEYAGQLIVYINGVIQAQAKEWEEFKPSWEKWFAWHPVKVDNKHKWLSTVYRKEIPVFGDAKLLPPRYEYGTLFDVLKDENQT